MKKVKIGIIGTGVGIRTHYKGFKPLEDAEIVAICGSSLQRSQEFAQKYDIPIACADYKELCDIDDIDLVCITSPNRFHYDAVMYAMQANKHIICEKPLSDNIEEVKALAQKSTDYNKIIVVDHQLRYNPYIQKIKEYIVTGQLGEIKTVNLHQTGTGFANPEAPWTWSFDGEQGGGVRLAMASHFTDLLQFWFGNQDIINITGYLSPVTSERKDRSGIIREVTASTSCNAFLNFANNMNVTYSINAGSYIGSRFDIDIFGTKGQLTFTLQDKLFFYPRDDIGNKQKVVVDNVFQDEAENKVSIFSGSFRYFAPIILNAIQTGNYNPLSISATFDSAQYNIGILDIIKKSANQGIGISLGKAKNNYV